MQPLDSLVAVKMERGQMVTANVRLERLLAEGAMGSVWAADHLSLRTQVAVKFIAASLAENCPESVARFELEAAASACINSPNVVRVFDQGISDGTRYIVMELLHGESLEVRLRRARWLSVRQTLDVVTQVGRGLAAAHAEGVIHRDIKPSNVFLETSEQGVVCKILDFGIAKQLGMAAKITHPGTSLGTPEYMCREAILRSSGAAPQHDLWSLAVVAYECLTGRTPFAGETMGALCVAICAGAFEAPSSVRPGLPAAFDDWFAQALNTNIKRRFGDAIEFYQAFAEVCASHPAVAVGELQRLAARTPGQRRGGATDIGMGPIELTPASLPRVSTNEIASTRAVSTPTGTPQPPPPDKRARRWGPALLAALTIAVVVLVMSQADLDSEAPGAMLPGPPTSHAPASAPSARAKRRPVDTVQSAPAPSPSITTPSITAPSPHAPSPQLLPAEVTPSPSVPHAPPGPGSVKAAEDDWI